MSYLTEALGTAIGVGHTATAAAAWRVETTSDLGTFIARTAAAETTCFQSGAWLGPLMATLAPAARAEPLCVVVTEAGTDRLALGLPLAVTREAGLSVASIASFGVSDYAASLIGPAAPETPDAAHELWATVTSRLAGVDLVRFTNMPARVAGRPNPLALLAGTSPSRHAAHSVTLDGTVEDFLRARGKKYRKEAERCYRLLDKAGAWRFRRAETETEIAAAYAALSVQQRARRERAGDTYLLDRPEYDAFYQRLACEGAASGFAHLFTLEIEGETVAALFGVTHAGAFTLLRISTAGEAWRQLSPGRLVVLEAMRLLLGRGIRSFDMGIGTYAFKEGLGAEAVPLADLTLALSLKAQPYALLARAKAKARDYPRLLDLAKRLTGRG